jgi:hypothetical protein
MAANSNITINTNFLTSESQHALELKVHNEFLVDALQAILHTLLFLRAPNGTPVDDGYCETLKPLMFMKCKIVDVDQKIK